jgi:small-conductance mechanosensitive channel
MLDGPGPPIEGARVPPLPRVVSVVENVPVRELVVAGAILIVAFLVTHGISLWVNRALQRHRAAGSVDPESSTRLIVSRRLINALVWVLAAALALSQFEHLRVLSAGLLASAGLSGLIVGFAARSTLGNAIAGVTIAFAQPFRIGDDIEFRSDRGIVEDITLFFTVLRLGDGKRLVIPNDVLSSEVTRNLTLGQASRWARVEVLVPPRTDAVAIRQALLVEALSFEGLDTETSPPEVVWVRLDERGALMRLIAPCKAPSLADQLAQRALGRAVELAFRASRSND